MFFNLKIKKIFSKNHENFNVFSKKSKFFNFKIKKIFLKKRENFTIFYLKFLF